MKDKRIQTSERIQKEAEFHDALMRTSNAGPGFYELGANRHAFGRLLGLLGDIRDKNILDFGCGCGWIAVELAKRGAVVDAFDISEEGLKAGERYAAKVEVAERIRFKKDNAENLSYGDNMFDLVVGGGILHHLELEAAFGQIHRVLKPGGRALFLEPLGHNPVINLYRRLTPERRTVDEHPLLIPEIRAHTSQFSHVSCEYFYFLALAAFLFMVVVKSPFLFQKSLSALCKIDDHLLRWAPPLRRFCWSTIIVLRK